jgi:hypothetical protein
MHCLISIRISNQGGVAWMVYVTDKGIKMHAEFSWKNLKQPSSKT